MEQRRSGLRKERKGTIAKKAERRRAFQISREQHL